MMRLIRTIRLKRLPITPVYVHQIWFSVKQQVVLVVLASLVLDMGQTVRMMAATIIGYWIGVVIILVRRPLSPSKGDLLFVRWGCCLLAAIFLFVYFTNTAYLQGRFATAVGGK